MFKENFCKTILKFASAKFIAWGLGVLILADNMEAYTIFPQGQYYLPLIMILVGLIGIVNAFLQEKIIYIVNSFLYSLFWIYSLYIFGFSSISFYRNIPETLAIIYACGYAIVNFLDYKEIWKSVKSSRLMGVWRN